MKDVWTMVNGWNNKLWFHQMVARKQTVILGEIINVSAGGKGVSDFVLSNWKLKGDGRVSSGIDPAKISLILKAHAANKNARRVKNNSRS